MPRSRSCSATSGVASWLFAPPQTMLAGQHRHGLPRPARRRARRARRRRAAVRDQLGGVGGRLHLRVAAPAAASTAAGSTSVTRTSAPSSTRWPTSHEPTLPTPATATVRPDRVGEPQRVLGGGAHALEDAVGGEHRGVAAAAVGLRAPVREPGLPGDDVEVGVVRADVARGQVAAAQRLDEPAVGAQQRLGLVGARVADDHGLAAAEVEPGEAVLVGHRPRERERRRRARPPRRRRGRTACRRGPDRARSSGPR